MAVPPPPPPLGGKAIGTFAAPRIWPFALRTNCATVVASPYFPTRVPFGCHSLRSASIVSASIVTALPRRAEPSGGPRLMPSLPARAHRRPSSPSRRGGDPERRARHALLLRAQRPETSGNPPHVAAG